MSAASGTRDSIAALVDLVSWTAVDSPRLLDDLEEEYASAVAERLGVVLAHLIESLPAEAAALESRLRSLDAERLDAFLLDPETSRRVVLEHLHPLPDTARALQRLAAGGAEARDPVLREVARLDEGIPVLLDGEARTAAQAEITAEIARVNGLRALLAAQAPAVARTTATAMRELVLRFEGPGAGFRSNSPQGYVGRAVLNNPADADDVALLEALVHEPIHGMVGMSEAVGLVRGDRASCWVYDEGMYDGESRTVSPWTNTPLDLPTYLHACFVWYGLLQLWTHLYQAPGLDPERVRNRITRALVGFADNGAAEQLRPYADSVNPSLSSIVAAMCSTVEGMLKDRGE